MKWLTKLLFWRSRTIPMKDVISVEIISSTYIDETGKVITINHEQEVNQE